MRIGLLVCDHVLDHLLPIEGDYPDMFRDLVGREGVEVETFDVVGGEMPEDLDSMDGWIITGSRWSVFDDEPWIHDLAHLTRRLVEEHHKVVGVCFGHQMLAHALGGEVRRSERGWGVGLREVQVEEAPDWMGETAGSYKVLHSHRDQIEALPPGGRILAATEHCPISMMAIGDNAWGLQGHPEYSRDYSRAALELRRDRVIAGSLVDEALATMEEAPDRRLVADWILRFFE